MTDGSRPKPRRWERVQEVFQAAVESPVEERERVLGRFVQSDPEAAEEARRLVAGHEGMKREFLEPPQVEAMPGPGSDSAMVGGRIGSYEITRLIGVGGMGAVYEARQEHPRRTVALKVVRPWLMSEGGRKRFEQEAEMLARLKHRGIAQIYEAGLDTRKGDGVPYYAMEYVAGAKTIVAYAEQKGLSAREKLELMAEVCDAVHHGHQRGVIHRDLKPANILVDSEGQVKVIDFGVARAVDAPVQQTMSTKAEQVLGTLQYMSPEQLEADAGDVDTRADVYGLGAVLYEMLAGRTAVNVEGAAILRAMEMVRTARPTPLGQVRASLRGDVERMVEKAMCRDRQRRYESAAGFAADIRRYLRSEPIEARPATRVYQLRLFAKRNKGLMWGMGVAAAGLVLGTTGAVWQAVRAKNSEGEALQAAERSKKDAQAARASASRSQAMVNAMRELLMTLDRNRSGYSEEASRVSAEESAEGILDVGRDVVRHQLQYQPDALADMLDVMGNVYLGLGRRETARVLYEDALRVRQETFGEDHVAVSLSKRSMAALAMKEGRLETARGLLAEAEAIQRKALGESDPEVLATVMQRPLVEYFAGNYEEAWELVQEARERYMSGAKPAGQLSIANMGAELARVQGRLEESWAGYEEARSIIEGTTGVTSLHYGANLYYRAAVAVQMGDKARMAVVRKDCGELARHTAGLVESHPHQSGVMLAEGLLDMGAGVLEQARGKLQRSVELRERYLGSEHKLTAYSRSVLAECLARQGQLKEAEAMLERAKEILERDYGGHHMWMQEVRAREELIRGMRGAG